MPSDVFTPHNPSRIDPAHDIPVLVEFWVQHLEVFGFELMFFRPMWSAVVSGNDGCEYIVKLAIRNSKAVRSRK